jgi:hypothetical protein
MRRSLLTMTLTCWPLLLPLGLGGCDESIPEVPKPPAPRKIVEVGKNVALEVQGDKRRVRINAFVCMREGQLELFLCRKNTKEHEAILAADVDARSIHRALLLAGGREGTPVTYVPKYKPASGQSIRIHVEYDLKGKRITTSAQSWIKNIKTGKPLDSDWVFAGSRLVPNPLDPNQPKIYLANDGDIICVSNFETALLDLPIESSKENANLVFETFTEKIPPLNTKVTVILEPLAKTKKN